MIGRSRYDLNASSCFGLDEISADPSTGGVNLKATMPGPAAWVQWSADPYPECALVNDVGLPASPFAAKLSLKTDDAVELLVASSPEDTWISNDVGLWKDTDGNPLHAHGGGMHFEDGQYYFVGVGKMAYDQPYFDAYSVTLYRSTDLGEWTLLSPSILNKSAFINSTFKSPLINAQGPVVLSRPKLIKSAATGRYILWTGFMSRGRGTCVASSDTIDGDYTLESCFMPNKRSLPTCDATVFHDESGEFFLAADTGSHAYEGISKLSKSGLSVTSADCNTVRCNGSSSCAMFQNKTTAGEAPALFRSPASGKAYLWTSHLSGWAPNAAMLYEGTTETLCGAMQDFKLLGNPSLSPTTHNSQSTYIQPVVHADNSTTLLYMSDRWCNPGFHWGPGGGTCAPNGNVSNATYLWLPLYPNASAPSGWTLPYLKRWRIGDPRWRIKSNLV